MVARISRCVPRFPQNSLLRTNLVVEQEKWVHDIFRKLLEMDHRSILNIMLYVPPGSTAADIGYENLPRLFRIQDALDFSWLLNKEWAAEAGNMAISGELKPQSPVNGD